MQNIPLFIINPNATLAKKAKTILNQRNIKYVINYSKKNLKNLLNEKIKEGYNNFIIAGGDGTINNFINAYMRFPLGIRTSIKVGFLPCGKTNDLSAAIKMPLDINKALDLLLRGRYIERDIIRVNDCYFITGGALGLPMEVVQDVYEFSNSKFGKIISNSARSLVYYLFVVKKMILGYKGIKNLTYKNHKISKLMLAFISNQSFIGKRFILAPDAKNNDGIFEVCFIKKPKNIFFDFYVLHKVINEKHLRMKNITQISTKKIKITTDKKMGFMGDGELLCKSDTFEIQIVPRAVKVIS